MLRYATCDLRCVLHMLCMYVGTFHCPNANLDQWRGGGEKHLKLNWKTCFSFPMANVTYLTFSHTHAQKEDITLFDSKSTSIHSLIIQHVYTLKKWHCIHGQNGTRLKGDTLGAGVENASFHNFVNGELLWNIFWWLTRWGQRPRKYQKGNLFEIKIINIGIKIDFCLILFDLVLYVPSTIFS